MRLTPKRIALLLIFMGIAIVGFLAMSLFGPSTPVVVSPQTTYLSGPLDPYGRIDYVAALRRDWSEGVTTENNAAALIWQALGPADIPADRQPSFFAELGIPHLPPDGDYYIELQAETIRPHITDWVQRQTSLPSDSPLPEGLPPDPDVGDLELQSVYRLQAADAYSEFVRFTEHTQHAAWRSEDFPPLAKWLELNEGPLALVIEASKRPRYFSPFIIGDVGPGMGPLFSMLLPDVQRARSLARALCHRAMLRMGEGGAGEAWQDLQAVHRLARLIGQQGPLVTQLVAIAMDRSALLADAALLHGGELSTEELRDVQAFLMQLTPPCRMGRTIDKVERLMTLDSIAHVSRHGFGENAMGIEDVLLQTGVDWNIPLKTMNRWYDRLAEAAEHPTIDERRAAMLGIDSELAAFGGSLTPGTVAGALFSRAKRSEVVGKLMVALFLPAVHAAQQAEDRAAISLRLVQVAAALAIHRAEHGSYPAALADLDLQVAEELTQDPYAGKSLLYERRHGGYVLWSVGPNLQDDRASGQALCYTVDGEFVADDSPHNSALDDIVLRVPSSPATSGAAEE